jgi:hypothetical protein
MVHGMQCISSNSSSGIACFFRADSSKWDTRPRATQQQQQQEQQQQRLLPSNEAA